MEGIFANCTADGKSAFEKNPPDWDPKRKAKIEGLNEAIEWQFSSKTQAHSHEEGALTIEGEEHESKA